MALSQTAADTKALNDLITSTLGVISQFVASLADNAFTNAKSIETPPDPLQILHDAAKLLKAHVTKLSLLTINKPFTPSALTKVLREFTATCLPAIMSAVQICAQEKAIWGDSMGREVQVRVRKLFKEMECLLQEVRNIAQGSGARLGGKRDSLSSTGVVWESCDALIELQRLGVAGLAVQKAEQWRDTIRDAITELQEWAAGEDLNTEGQRDVLLDSDDEGVGGDTDSLDDFFNAANSMPTDRPELKALVDESVEKLKKVGILYNALIKRRLKVYKPGAVEGKPEAKSGAVYLDHILGNLKAMPHMVDELANAFYELDEEQAKDMLTKLLGKARDTASIAETTRENTEDQFSPWSRKWKEAVG